MGPDFLGVGLERFRLLFFSLQGKEDEFFLGRMPSSKTAKTGSDDGDDSQLEAKTSSTSKKVW